MRPEAARVQVPLFSMRPRSCAEPDASGCWAPTQLSSWSVGGFPRELTCAASAYRRGQGQGQLLSSPSWARAPCSHPDNTEAVPGSASWLHSSGPQQHT